MSSFRSEWTAAPDLHPEFGYLCPSPRLRRRMRLVLAAVMAAVVVGATMALAAAHRGDADSLTLTIQPETDADSTRPSESALDVAAPAALAHDPCKSDATRDPAASFLNSACRSRKLHARHGARAAYRVAIVVLGRTDASRAPSEAAPVMASANEPARVEKPTALMLSTHKQHPRKKAAAGIAVAHELSHQNTPFNAYAYNPYYGGFRSDSLQHGFSGSFGRW